MENRNIYQRMSAIINEMGVVAKNLKVQATKTSSYEAVSERDILDTVKPLEVKYGVYSYPYKRETEVLEELVNNPTQYNPEGKRVAIRITTTYRFVNIDKPDEYIDIISYGDGVDTLDKAPGKAMTYADKYALMKAYKISTGDDPDQEASPAESNNPVKKQAEIKKATDEQIEKLKHLMPEERYHNMLKHCGVETAKDLDYKVAADFIKKLEAKQIKSK